ncbi:MAG: PEP-CTERM sorting domain-containing protein [Gemmatimonadaceae bacterium]|jgi:hypothetical protein|nr:PEP-CTERM sorting domain-containing protein [Gemmatimonadaceae bacterium]
MTTISYLRRPWRCALAALALASPLSAQTTYGGDLIDRPASDVYVSWVAIADTPFAAWSIGEQLLSVAVFGKGAGQIAPMLVENVGGSWTVRARGLTRNVAAGLNSWSFDAVFGSTTIANANYRFAWWNSGGVVPFSGGGTSIIYSPNGAYSVLPTDGATLLTEGNDSRTYSLQWTVSGSPPDPDPDPDPTPVPEPSTLGLLLVGAIGALQRRRRA